MKGRTFERMKEKLAGNEIIADKHFVEPLRQDKDRIATEARSWVKQVMASLNQISQHVA
jgi:SepF-like predicted cell division protein (DUF552 family)